MTPPSILVSAPNWVGDSIFMLPAVAALRRHFGAAARLTLLAKPGICALHGASPLFDEWVSLEGDSQLARLASQLRLRGRRFDFCVVFGTSFSSALGAFLSGARVRVGRPGQGRDFLLNLKSPLPAADRQRHVSEEYLDLARLAGAQTEPQDKLVKLSLTQGGAEEQGRLFREHGLKAGPLLVALCPTSAYGPSKMWPAEKFAELARLLKGQRFQPYLLCAPNESAQVLGISREAGGVPVLAPSLPGLAAALSASSVVVANDSGPLHIAAAVGVRCLGLYGPVDPKWSAPLSQRSSILYTAEPCSPCFAKDCPLKHHDCMRHIEPSQALQAVTELLKR
jgi:heptosyltransferase-2